MSVREAVLSFLASYQFILYETTMSVRRRRYTSSVALQRLWEFDDEDEILLDDFIREESNDNFENVIDDDMSDAKHSIEEEPTREFSISSSSSSEDSSTDDDATDYSLTAPSGRQWTELLCGANSGRMPMRNNDSSATRSTSWNSSRKRKGIISFILR